MSRNSSLSLRAALALASVLGACADYSNTRGDLSATVAISPARKMYIECRGNGSPTVVLVAGQRGSAAEWSITESRAVPPHAAVFDAVARFTRVCAYDRPGTPVGESFSRSDPALQPTTAAAATADLRALLRSAGEDAPYVIVGHSERRQLFGETDEKVRLKAAAVFKAGMTPVVCVGEVLEQREEGKTFEVVGRQAEEALTGLNTSSPRNRKLPRTVRTNCSVTRCGVSSASCNTVWLGLSMAARCCAK